MPRSGSTLLQKLLMSHSSIASVAEPWLLLPLCYSFKENGLLAEYGHNTYLKGMRSIYENLPAGIEDYRKALNQFCCQIYSRLADGAPYFLDKTPMYFLIINEIAKIFEDAKFIFLVRNPINIFASSISGLRCNSARRLDQIDRILFSGPKNIADGYKDIKVSKYLVSYEDLVTDPQKQLSRLCAFLEIDYQENMLSDWRGITLDGLGDKKIDFYKSIKNDADSWKSVVDTQYRKKRLIRYLQQFPAEYLELGSYNREKLITEARESLPSRLATHEYLYFAEETFIKYLSPLSKGYGMS